MLVSPDGALGLVPLEALPGKAAGSYLIEEYSIALVPVARMFGADEAVAAVGPKPALAQAEAPSLLMVGDVDYGGDPGAGPDHGASRSAAVGTRAGLLPDFPKLPATGDEIEAIGRYFKHRFGGTHLDMLSGDLATEAAVREAAPEHRFLHLATHSYFAPPKLRSALGPTALGPSDPAARPGTDFFGAGGVAGFHPGLLSGLALAGANVRPTPFGKDDGILTALEVAALDLSRCVSACETGLGVVAGGEGLLGLQRAFQVAGARAVVASLWTVSDEATRALMSRFYENLWGHGLPAHAALREAQLFMLREGLRRGGGGIWRDVKDASKSDGFDLRLMSSLNDVSGIPSEGKNLIFVATVNNVLHFRIFDGDGKVVVDTDEKRLTEQARQIEDLRKQLKSLWPPHELTTSDKGRVFTAVTSIVGHTKSDRTPPFYWAAFVLSTDRL